MHSRRELAELRFGQRRAHRGDDVGVTGLMRAQRVHVAFDDDGLFRLADRVAGQVNAEQNMALVKERRLRRVEVLGFLAGQRPRAKTDRVTFGIADRNHQPPAKAVEHGAVVALDEQPRRDEFLARIAAIAQVTFQRVPIVQAVAELET